MKLHWFFSNLVVGLLTAQALAFPCWTCCPNGPLCSRDPDTINYRHVVGVSTTYTNAQVLGTKLTAAQWSDLATRLQNAKNEMDNNGAMADLYLFFKANVKLLEAPTFDASKLVPAMQSLGYQGSAKQLAWVISTWTQAQRIGLVSYVLKYGFDAVFDGAIAAAQAIANAEASHAPYNLCHIAAGGAAWFTFAAGAAALIGQEELAVPLVFIGGTFALAGWEGGCY